MEVKSVVEQPCGNLDELNGQYGCIIHWTLTIETLDPAVCGVVGWSHSAGGEQLKTCGATAFLNQSETNADLLLPKEERRSIPYEVPVGGRWIHGVTASGCAYVGLSSWGLEDNCAAWEHPAIFLEGPSVSQCPPSASASAAPGRVDWHVETPIASASGFVAPAGADSPDRQPARASVHTTDSDPCAG